MIAATLSAVLDRRAGGFLAAAQFSRSPSTVRAGTIIGTAATVAHEHGIAGVEGYLAALELLGSEEDQTAHRMIRACADEAITELSFLAWSGGPSAEESAADALYVHTGEEPRKIAVSTAQRGNTIAPIVA
jgi:hypothetical protein